MGAAVLTETGEVFSGCNVENSSYGLSLCAERAALCQAIAAGQQQFRLIAVVAGEDGRLVTPCGACRQFLAEFLPDFPVLLQPADPAAPSRPYHGRRALPGAFHFNEQ